MNFLTSVLFCFGVVALGLAITCIGFAWAASRKPVPDEPSVCAPTCAPPHRVHLTLFLSFVWRVVITLAWL